MADQNYVIDEPESAKARYGISGNAICKRLINFGTGLSDLSPPHRQALAEIKAQLRSEGDTIYIIGHASKRGGAHFDNKGLSERRAKAVYDWFAYYMDTNANKLHPSGTGDTETLGTTDPNDKRDRAVVVIAQSSTAPIPKVLPDFPHTTPDQPDTPLPLPGMPLLRRTGWKFNGQGSLTESFSFINQGLLGVSGVIGAMRISLKKLSTGTVNDYTMFGTGISGVVGKGLLDKAPGIGQQLKRLGLNVGPSSFPNPGTEILATPLLGEPITAASFAGPAFILSGAGTVGPGQGSVNLLLFSKLPMSPGPFPDPGMATITALCSFAGPGINVNPALSASIDRFSGQLTLLKT